MPRLVAALALSTLLSVPAASAGGPRLKTPPKMSKAVVYTEITPEQALAIVQPLADQAEVERPGAGQHDQVWFQVDGLNSLMYVRNEGEGSAPVYWFAASFDFDLDVPLSMANDWNSGHLYSRAYVDDEGDIVLESDLDLAGGVTEERIVDHVRTWRQLLGEFTTAIGFYEEGTLSAPDAAEAPMEAAPEATEAAPEAAEGTPAPE